MKHSKTPKRKAKLEKKTFDVCASDIETGEETLARVLATDKRQAIQITKKLIQSSPLLRKTTYGAFTAVEMRHDHTRTSCSAQRKRGPV